MQGVTGLVELAMECGRIAFGLHYGQPGDTRNSTDGLEGREGTFVLCTLWLAHALALAHQPTRARQVFERALSYVSDVGLLAEEVDPATGELLGNFPPAFSHIGLVNAAWAISEAERHLRGRAAVRCRPGRLTRGRTGG